MKFFSKNTYKILILTQKDEESSRKKNLCWFSWKDFDSKKVEDHCHLSGKYKRPAHEFFNVNVKQKMSVFSISIS